MIVYWETFWKTETMPGKSHAFTDRHHTVALCGFRPKYGARISIHDNDCCERCWNALEKANE